MVKIEVDRESAVSVPFSLEELLSETGITLKFLESFLGDRIQEFFNTYEEIDSLLEPGEYLSLYFGENTSFSGRINQYIEIISPERLGILYKIGRDSIFTNLHPEI